MTTETGQGPGRQMRRAEKEIVDLVVLDEILQAAQVLYLALRDEPAPYVIPVFFAHAEETLFVHSAIAGTKIDLLRAHPVVGFCACSDVTITPRAAACDYSAAARSVVGTGRARILEREDERRGALDAIMRHYAPGAFKNPAYRPGSLSRTCVIAVRIDSLHGKGMGLPIKVVTENLSH